MTQKPTRIQIYNAVLNTLGTGVATFVLIAVLNMNSRYATVTGKLDALLDIVNYKYANVMSVVNELKMDQHETIGIVNGNTNRIIKVEAILTDKKQFNIKSE